MKTIEEIKDLFRQEFGSLAERFEVFDLDLRDARDSQARYVWHPGVYVWWHPSEGVVKVGRHLTNSRKRAFEHITDDTGGKLAGFAESGVMRLLLFNVKESEDRHWVAALEIFFESTISPSVRSKRLG